MPHLMVHVFRKHYTSNGFHADYLEFYPERGTNLFKLAYHGVIQQST
jgi:hypothetical protein